MLIESQAQKVLSDQKKVIDKPTLMDVDDGEPVHEEKSDATKDTTDIEMKEQNSEKPKEEISRNVDRVLDDFPSIDIDPKTYCKLGHFHLLLEDYAKGKK